jgi:hypothetical protein
VAVGYLTIGTVAEVAGTGNQHGILASIIMGVEGLPDESRESHLVCGAILEGVNPPLWRIQPPMMSADLVR